MTGINPIISKDFIGKKVKIISKKSIFYNQKAIINSIENYYAVRLKSKNKIFKGKSLLFLWKEIEVIE